MSTVSATEAQSASTYSQREVKKDDQWGQQTFMKILAAQLKYQDPMEGTDTSQMMSQMAQYSSLEQMQILNNSFNNMIARQEVVMASMWIGKEVMAMGVDDTEPVTGKVQGIAFDADYGVLMVVDGREYTLDQIIAIKEAGEAGGIVDEIDPGEPTDTDDTTDKGDGPEETDTNQDGENEGNGDI